MTHMDYSDLLRMRAEILLDRIFNKLLRKVIISEEHLEKLERIATSPKPEDHEFLSMFENGVDRWP